MTEKVYSQGMLFSAGLDTELLPGVLSSRLGDSTDRAASK